ncbi:putative surface protein TolT, partial [Trypanosoma cruzi]
VKDEKTKVGSGPELLKRAAEQTVLSLEKAKEAEAETEKAAAAAQKTREAAEKAAAARTLAQDVAATAIALLRQREKEEERRRARDREEAYVGNERAENAMRGAWLGWVECCVAVLVNEGALRWQWRFFLLYFKIGYCYGN